ncbi:MAG TPA: helix-turn-helix domain-containing protein [Coriobacteriia bacterium]|nr:helix-turn-helix domain-containing protein [Coriobacteriia bacterium]
MTELLTLPEVSGRLRVPEATLRYWRSRGVGPRSFRVGRRVMYRTDVVDEWLMDQERAAGPIATGAGVAS